MSLSWRRCRSRPDGGGRGGRGECGDGRRRQGRRRAVPSFDDARASGGLFPENHGEADLAGGAGGDQVQGKRKQMRAVLYLYTDTKNSNKRRENTELLFLPGRRTSWCVAGIRTFLAVCKRVLLRERERRLLPLRSVPGGPATDAPCDTPARCKRRLLWEKRGARNQAKRSTPSAWCLPFLRVMGSFGLLAAHQLHVGSELRRCRHPPSPPPVDGKCRRTWVLGPGRPARCELKIDTPCVPTEESPPPPLIPRRAQDSESRDGFFTQQ